MDDDGWFPLPFVPEQFGAVIEDAWGKRWVFDGFLWSSGFGPRETSEYFNGVMYTVVRDGI